MLHSKLGTQDKLGKAAGVRIAGAAVFNSGTMLAVLGAGGVKLIQSGVAEAGIGIDPISIVLATLGALALGGVAMAGLIAMAMAGTDQLREEEQWLEMTSKRGASKVAHPMKAIGK